MTCPKAILDFFPRGRSPLPQQVEVLQAIERNWTNMRVFVVTAPTASGKSFIATTVGKWAESQGLTTSILTPTRLLQEQYQLDFPETPNLRGIDHYRCDTVKGPCGQRTLSTGDVAYCKGCPYVKAKKSALTASTRFFNYYTYFAHAPQSYSDVLIVDEAHNLLSTLSDLSSMTFWKHKHHYPNKIRTVGDLVLWMERQRQRTPHMIRQLQGNGPKIRQLKQRTKHYEMLIADMQYRHNDFYIEHSEKYYRGQKLECLSVKPVSLKHLPPKFWPFSVKKIVLLSATIGPQEIDELGLAPRRPMYLHCSSPIPPKRRPFIVESTANMGYSKRKESLPKIAEKIREYAETHRNHKGFIHCSYDLAMQLRFFLPGERFVWHNKENKEEQFQKFKDSKNPLIFVASGMEEGIDLVYDSARWQVLVTVPYISWKDGWVREKTERDKTWYHRQAAKTIQQQTGRICRKPDDVGVTYMLDSRFQQCYYEHVEAWPEWFRESIVWAS